MWIGSFLAPLYRIDHNYRLNKSGMAFQIVIVQINLNFFQSMHPKWEN